jgi:hypothetical protein
MADIYGGIMGGLALARQGAQEKKARGLAALVGQAYTAPREQRQGLLGQIAGIDPATATQTQASLGAWDDSKQKALVRSAQMLLAAPEEARPQVWAQIVQAGEIPGLKPEYDPVKVPEMAQKIVSAFGQSSMPAELQTWGALTSGLSEADRQKALRVKLGLDPRAGLLDIGEYAGGVYGVNRDPNNVHAVPVPIGAPQPSGREVPFTIDPSLPPEIQADIRASEARGMPWEQGPQLQAAPPKVSPVQIAQLELSQQAAARDAERLRLAQQDAARKASAGTTEQRKSVIEARKKMPQLHNAIRGVDRIAQALQSLNGGMVNTGPADQYIQRFTKEGQELEAAVGAIQNSVLALTRVPGVGSQSDLEQRVAMLQYPSLDKAPEVNARTMQNLRLFLQDLQDAYENVLGGQQDAQQGSAIPVNGTSDDDLIGKYL